MIRLQMIGLWGGVERNAYLVKRYGWWELAFLVWTIANTLTIVFIAKGVAANGGHLDVERETASLLIGAVTGTTFHSRREKWPAKLRPIDWVSVAVMAIWRRPSMRGMPIATRVALLR